MANAPIDENHHKGMLFKDGVTGEATPVEGNAATGAVYVEDVGTLVSEFYDYISVAYPSTTTEVYTYKSGGASGTLVATVTVEYVDATKDQLSTVTRS